MGRGKRPAVDDAADALLSLSCSPKRGCTEPPHALPSSSSSPSPATNTLPEAALELYTLLQEDRRATARQSLPEKATTPMDHSTSAWEDIEVLTSASVLLAACGVQHALQLATGSSQQLALSPHVCSILRSECLHVRTLDGPKIARLCFLLQLSPSVGATWHVRVERLCHQLTQYLENPLGAPHIIPTCAAAARSAFHSAVPHAVKPGGLISQFGRQTVWCIVTMLSRIQREAGLADGDLGLQPCRTDQQLASMAVSVISGSMANIGG